MFIVGLRTSSGAEQQAIRAEDVWDGHRRGRVSGVRVQLLQNVLSMVS
jgi:hypothetical protein